MIYLCNFIFFAFSFDFIFFKPLCQNLTTEVYLNFFEIYNFNNAMSRNESEDPNANTHTTNEAPLQVLDTNAGLFTAQTQISAYLKTLTGFVPTDLEGIMKNAMYSQTRSLGSITIDKQVQPYQILFQRPIYDMEINTEPANLIYTAASKTSYDLLRIECITQQNAFTTGTHTEAFLPVAACKDEWIASGQVPGTEETYNICQEYLMQKDGDNATPTVTANSATTFSSVVCSINPPRREFKVPTNDLYERANADNNGQRRLVGFFIVQAPIPALVYNDAYFRATYRQQKVTLPFGNKPSGDAFRDILRYAHFYCFNRDTSIDEMELGKRAIAPVSGATETTIIYNESGSTFKEGSALVLGGFNDPASLDIGVVDKTIKLPAGRIATNTYDSIGRPNLPAIQGEEEGPEVIETNSSDPHSQEAPREVILNVDYICQSESDDPATTDYTGTNIVASVTANSPKILNETGTINGKTVYHPANTDYQPMKLIGRPFPGTTTEYNSTFAAPVYFEDGLTSTMNSHPTLARSAIAQKIECRIGIDWLESINETVFDKIVSSYLSQYSYGPDVKTHLLEDLAVYGNRIKTELAPELTRWEEDPIALRRALVDRLSSSVTTKYLEESLAVVMKDVILASQAPGDHPHYITRDYEFEWDDDNEDWQTGIDARERGVRNTNTTTKGAQKFHGITHNDWVSHLAHLANLSACSAGHEDISKLSVEERFRIKQRKYLQVIMSAASNPVQSVILTLAGAMNGLLAPTTREVRAHIPNEEIDLHAEDDYSRIYSLPETIKKEVSKLENTSPETIIELFVKDRKLDSVSYHKEAIVAMLKDLPKAWHTVMQSPTKNDWSEHRVDVKIVSPRNLEAVLAALQQYHPLSMKIHADDRKKGVEHVLSKYPDAKPVTLKFKTTTYFTTNPLYNFDFEGFQEYSILTSTGEKIRIPLSLISLIPGCKTFPDRNIYESLHKEFYESSPNLPSVFMPFVFAVDGVQVARTDFKINDLGIPFNDEAANMAAFSGSFLSNIVPMPSQFTFWGPMTESYYLNSIGTENTTQHNAFMIDGQMIRSVTDLLDRPNIPSPDYLTKFNEDPKNAGRNFSIVSGNCAVMFNDLRLTEDIKNLKKIAPLIYDVTSSRDRSQETLEVYCNLITSANPDHEFDPRAYENPELFVGTHFKKEIISGFIKKNSDLWNKLFVTKYYDNLGGQRSDLLTLNLNYAMRRPMELESATSTAHNIVSDKNVPYIGRVAVQDWSKVPHPESTAWNAGGPHPLLQSREEIAEVLAKLDNGDHIHKTYSFEEFDPSVKTTNKFVNQSINTNYIGIGAEAGVHNLGSHGDNTFALHSDFMRNLRKIEDSVFSSDELTEKDITLGVHVKDVVLYSWIPRSTNENRASTVSIPIEMIACEVEEMPDGSGVTSEHEVEMFKQNGPWETFPTNTISNDHELSSLLWTSEEVKRHTKNISGRLQWKRESNDSYPTPITTFHPVYSLDGRNHTISFNMSYDEACHASHYNIDPVAKKVVNSMFTCELATDFQVYPRRQDTQPDLKIPSKYSLVTFLTDSGAESFYELGVFNNVKRKLNASQTSIAYRVNLRSSVNSPAVAHYYIGYLPNQTGLGASCVCYLNTEVKIKSSFDIRGYIHEVESAPVNVTTREKVVLPRSIQQHRVSSYFSTTRNDNCHPVAHRQKTPVKIDQKYNRNNRDVAINYFNSPRPLVMGTTKETVPVVKIIEKYVGSSDIANDLKNGLVDPEDIRKRVDEIDEMMNVQSLPTPTF
jgi:hypothetical protein